MDLLLNGMSTLIMGGGGGIGAKIARTLAVEGARVAIADRDDPAAQKLAGDLGLPAIAITCDVQNKEDIVMAVRKTTDHFGSLRALVHTVGVTVANYLPEINDLDIEQAFSINMRGALWAAQAAYAPMKSNNYGRMVFIGSASGMKGSAGLALYSASKFFLRGLTQAIGLELGPSGITANVICPSDVYPDGDESARSWIDHRLIRISCEKENAPDFEALKQNRIQKNPMRRSCLAEDISSLTAFLCSPLAGFINAQTIGLTGGSLPT